MRKLANILLIWKNELIESADRIELAHVLGWQCVVKSLKAKINMLSRQRPLFGCSSKNRFQPFVSFQTSRQNMFISTSSMTGW